MRSFKALDTQTIVKSLGDIDRFLLDEEGDYVSKTLMNPKDSKGSRVFDTQKNEGSSGDLYEVMSASEDEAY